MTEFDEAPSREAYLHILSQTTKQTISLIRAKASSGGMTTNSDRKNGLANIKLDFLQKETSRREMLRYSVTLAGSALLVHLLPVRLLRASTAAYAQQSPSAADLLASMRAKFNAVPMETQKLADNVTMFDGPGGAVT